MFILYGLKDFILRREFMNGKIIPRFRNERNGFVIYFVRRYFHILYIKNIIHFNFTILFKKALKLFN